MATSEFKIEKLTSGNGPAAKKGQTVTVHYTGWLTDGGKFDSSVDCDEPFKFVLGAAQVIAGWDLGVATMKVGDKRRVLVPAKDAYGPKDPANTTEMPLDQMPAKGIHVGDLFRAGADGHAPVVTVAKVTATHVTLDGNHPLAGLDLTFDVLTTPERLRVLERFEGFRRQQPAIEHPLINQLAAQARI